MTNEPIDKPSINFSIDPHLKDIYNKGQFGIVLVAGWPPNQSLVEPYHKFISQVEQCFDASDLQCANKFSHHHRNGVAFDADDGRNESKSEYTKETPNVYLYPVQHLHITIATFHPFHKKLNPTTGYEDEILASSTPRGRQDDYEKETYANQCKAIVENAMKRDGWPKQKIRLKIDKTQIGEKAGILLWNGCTDQDNELFHRMRLIVKEEHDKVMMKKFLNRNINGNPSFDMEREIKIPNIIHSTFLRFGGHPQTDGSEIQRRFQSLVQEKINIIFGDELCVDTVKLVVEKRAYMHIPCDEEHVLASMELR